MVRSAFLLVKVQPLKFVTFLFFIHLHDLLKTCLLAWSKPLVYSDNSAAGISRCPCEMLLLFRIPSSVTHTQPALQHQLRRRARNPKKTEPQHVCRWLSRRASSAISRSYAAPRMRQLSAGASSSSSLPGASCCLFFNTTGRLGLWGSFCVGTGSRSQHRASVEGDLDFLPAGVGRCCRQLPNWHGSTGSTGRGGSAPLLSLNPGHLRGV